MASQASYDLVVNVDDVGRVVRGVSVDTTCEDIVNVLSKISGKKEAQVLVELWHGCARPVALNERPLLLLAQWGRHRKQVSFALRDAALYVSKRSGGPGRRGYGVRCKTLGRSGRYLRRIRHRLQQRLDVRKRVRASLTDPSGGPDRAVVERDSLSSLLEARLDQLKSKQSQLEETKEKLLAARSRDGRPWDQKQGALTSIISRLEKELKLRSNLHQLQSTKIQEVQAEIASAEDRIRSLATSLMALRIDSETVDVLLSGQQMEDVMMS